MSRLIDADLLKEKLGISAYCTVYPHVDEDDIDHTPTVEAYTKEEVINMFEDLLSKIDERVAVPKDKTDKIAIALADGWNNSQMRDKQIIQEQINALRKGDK